MRVTLSKHSDATAEDFAQFLEGLDEVQQAHTVAGDADYLLHLRARSLDELGEFVLSACCRTPTCTRCAPTSCSRPSRRTAAFVSASAPVIGRAGREADCGVIPGLVPGIQRSASARASGTMDPGDTGLRRCGQAPG